MLDEVCLSPVVVAGLLSGLNGSSAAPDDLHPRMWEECSDALSLLLYLLFDRSLHDGVLLTLSYTSIATPLFKNRNRSDPLKSVAR